MKLEELIEGYLNESLDGKQTSELSQLLSDSHDARDEFRARVRIHGELAEHFSGAADARYTPIERPRRGLHYWRIGWSAAAAIFMLAVWLWPRDFEPIAEIVSETNAEWAKSVGPQLRPGRQQLLAGMVELKIGQSVRVAIEAPAEFELIDTIRMRVKRGRVAADVGEFGRGFTIETPEGKVIDLGTRFGVRVGDNGAAEVHVFDGEVDVVSSGETLRLVDDEALSLSGHHRVAADPWSFPMPRHELPVKFSRGNFDLQTNLGAGMPTQAGWWSGDSCKITQHGGSVLPFEGVAMLQFLASNSPVLPESTGQQASELWRIVDLQPYAQRVNAGEVTAKMVGHFNRSAGTSNSEFQMNLTSFRGQISEAGAYWERKNEPTSERLAASGTNVISDENPDSWEPLEVTMAVPPGSDFLLVGLLVFENETDRDENEFEGHFADGVTLNLGVKARSSGPTAVWMGEGAWRDSANWEHGLPDPARDRIVIRGNGEAVIESRVTTKQTMVIANHNDSTGRLRIAPKGELIKSGFGELIVGFNEGSRATLTIQGRLQTRSRVFIGRNNAESTVDIDGGDWDAGSDVIRMSQYGSRGPDTVSNLQVRNGGRLRAGALELVHDSATLNIEGGEVELGILRIGGDDGEALVRLSGGVLRVDELVFGSKHAEFRFESPEAELWLRGKWTPQQLLAMPFANWGQKDLVVNEDAEFTRIRVYSRK